jgi:hypothetical protein
VGVHGIEVFYAIDVDYGSRVQVYANYGFPSGDFHYADGQVEGELGEGGRGSDYALVRYKISDIWTIPAGS